MGNDSEGGGGAEDLDGAGGRTIVPMGGWGGGVLKTWAGLRLELIDTPATKA